MIKKVITLIVTLATCLSFMACGVFVDPTGINSGSSNESSTYDSASSDESTSSDSASSDDSTSSDSASSDDASSDDASSDDSTSSAPETITVTVTFKQAGKTDVIKTLEQGGTLTDIPTPQAKTGYIVEWNRTDFTNITEDITVTAIERVKTYTVTLNANGGTLTSTQFTITYGETYSLETPTNSDTYAFKGWTYLGQKIASNGTWTIDEEDCTIKLIADWELYSGEY